MLTSLALSPPVCPLGFGASTALGAVDDARLSVLALLGASCLKGEPAPTRLVGAALGGNLDMVENLDGFQALDITEDGRPIPAMGRQCAGRLRGGDANCDLMQDGTFHVRNVPRGAWLVKARFRITADEAPETTLNQTQGRTKDDA